MNEIIKGILIILIADLTCYISRIFQYIENYRLE